MDQEEQVIEKLKDLINKMSWLNKGKMEKALKGHKSSEIHCIEAIEKNTDPNVTKLADVLYMTRGAISKLTKKLLEKQLIETYQKENNKKEIYFRLTKEGKRLYDLHEELHREFQERDKVVFEQVTKEELESMLNFLDKYNHHLDEEIKKKEKTLQK